MLKDDACPGVRQGVCEALVALFKDRNDHLLAQLPNIMDFMLSKTQDSDDNVAKYDTRTMAPVVLAFGPLTDVLPPPCR
jgi:hypothetical protein